MKNKKIIQCPNCGEEEEYNPDFPFCKNCGLFLDDKKEIKKFNLSGENIKGISILLMSIFILIFIFVSRFYASVGVILSVLLYFYGNIYKRKQNNKNKDKKN